MERLLLDIYGQINEPDGIYAVARSHEMTSQLHLLQHEGAILGSMTVSLGFADATGWPSFRQLWVLRV